MEAAGLGVGVVALAGLFNNAVDSYNYVRVGKHYSRDFETSQIRLDLSRLQLSRWGEASGLTSSVLTTTQLPTALGSADDIAKAEKALGNIVNLLNNAQLLSQRYDDCEPLDTSGSQELKLHQRASRIIAHRQRNTSIMKKASRALYRKDYFENLVGKIVDLTNQ